MTTSLFSAQGHVLASDPPEGAGTISLRSLNAQIMYRADADGQANLVRPANTDAMEDTDVIYTDLIFPECISYGSTGVPIYLTDKVEVLSGAEQRNTRSRYPRHEYSIRMENLPADEIANVMNLWHVCSGDFAAFLFLDPLDHTSAWSETQISGTEVSATDQYIGIVGAPTDGYELKKTYEKGSRAKERRIRYPKLDTLVVAIDGTEVSNWTYSYSEQLLRFSYNVSAVNTTVDKVDGVITGSGMGAFNPGELVYIEGFSDSNLDRPGGGGEPLLVVAADGTQMVLTELDGSTWSGSESGASITIKGTPPPAGATITAGFYFYTPVRFEEGDNGESEIRAGLRESAVADFTQITLREVFE